MLEHAGYKRVEKQILHAISEDTLSSVLILSGPKGSGKKRLILEIARALLEDHTRKSERKTHPDFYELSEEDKGFSIDSIRRFSEELYKPPLLAKKKLAVFHQAERLSVVSQNALLKTLEEPPLDTTILLSVETKRALLPTVLSRAVVYSLQKPEKKEALFFLMNACGSGKKETEKALFLSQGCLEHAKKIIEQKDPLLPLFEELLQMENYLDYMSVVEKIALLDIKDREPIFFYFSLFLQELATGKEKTFPKSFLKTLDRPFSSMQSLLTEMLQAYRLHMKLEVCLEVLFFEMFEKGSRPAKLFS